MMNSTIKKTVGVTFLAFVLLAGCTTEESADIERVIEEDGAFSFDFGDSPVITFQAEGMQVMNAHNIPGDYPFPFDSEDVYEEYDVTYTDETLFIEAGDEVYELEILGPRLFRDNDNDLELSTEAFLFDEEG